MIKKLALFVIVQCVLMSPVYVFAQKISPAHANSSAAYKMKKDVAEKGITKIENLVAKIANGKRVSKGDAEGLDALIIEHAKAMNDAVKQAIADAKEAQDSKLQKGSTKSFVEFEDMAQKHEKRAKAVEAKVKKIDEQIKTGDIELDQPLLESMTPAERKEYMQYMTPGGRDKMKKKHPKLLSGISIKNKILVDLDYIGKSACELSRSNAKKAGDLLVTIPQTVGDFLVPPAEAALGLGAGTACGATGGLACALAIGGTVYGYLRVYDEFVQCLASQCTCRWYKPWCCAGKTGCWVKYIAECA